jgi:hypothetical protein
VRHILRSAGQKVFVVHVPLRASDGTQNRSESEPEAKQLRNANAIKSVKWLLRDGLSQLEGAAAMREEALKSK